MSGIHNTSSKFEQLRRQAEELIRKQPDLASETSGDVLELMHELNIHQAELEIQNEELKRAQQVLSELHREYENLYEFAPCGYVTLTAKGIITRINLAGVKLLGSARQTFCTPASLSASPLAGKTPTGKPEKEPVRAAKNTAQSCCLKEIIHHPFGSGPKSRPTGTKPEEWISGGWCWWISPIRRRPNEP